MKKILITCIFTIMSVANAATVWIPDVNASFSGSVSNTVWHKYENVKIIWYSKICKFVTRDGKTIYATHFIIEE